MTSLQLVALVVGDYDPAIRFFVDVLGFELVEDTPALTNDGRPKRWVVVRPAGGQTGLLLARADGDEQTSNNSGARALERARQAGVAAVHLSSHTKSTRSRMLPGLIMIALSRESSSEVRATLLGDAHQSVVWN